MKFFLYTFIIITTSFLFACKKDNASTATVKPVTTVGSFNGDVVGNGGSITKSYVWNNPKITADYSMDLTTTSTGGSFQLIVKDNNGNIVLDYTIIKGQTPDSKSGVTSTGTPGMWNVTIVLKSLNGDGSYSMSPGT